MSEPLRDDVFLSYTHADRDAAEAVVALLELAGLKVWVDWKSNPAGSDLPVALAVAAKQCRATVRLLSRRAEQGKYGKREESQGLGRSIRDPRRPLVPLWIESEPPRPEDLPVALEGLTTIHAPGGRFDLDGAFALLLALNPQGAHRRRGRTHDLFLSRPWPAAGRDPEESGKADRVCERLCDLGIRPIGDAEDHPHYDPARVGSLVRSCQGLVAVIPDRGGGRTSKYFAQEVRLAYEGGLPYALTTHGSPEFPPELVSSSVFERLVPADEFGPAEIAELIEEARRVRPEEHFLFFATPFRRSDRHRWERARDLAEHVTGVRCRTGEEFETPEEIATSIAKAQAVIADISYEAGERISDREEPRRGPNSLIEAGIALGSRRPLHLINATPRSSSPFLFRTTTQAKYESAAELLAVVHAAARGYRRRVLC